VPFQVSYNDNVTVCCFQIHVDFDDSVSNKTELNDIVTNTLLNVNFLALGRELDILEPKTPDEVYKTHLGNLLDSFIKVNERMR